MKTLISVILASLLLTGCAAFEEAYHLDREYGKAQQATWDNQVAYPDYRYAAKTPKVTEGITAEEIMGVHNETFAEEPEEVEVFQLDVTE